MKFSRTVPALLVVLLPLAEIAPGQVSATQLEKVQGQSIKRLPSD